MALSSNANKMPCSLTYFPLSPHPPNPILGTGHQAPGTRHPHQAGWLLQLQLPSLPMPVVIVKVRRVTRPTPSVGYVSGGRPIVSDSAWPGLLRSPRRTLLSSQYIQVQDALPVHAPNAELSFHHLQANSILQPLDISSFHFSSPSLKERKKKQTQYPISLYIPTLRTLPPNPPEHEPSILPSSTSDFQHVRPLLGALILIPI
ncbi:hypothetical protein L249_3556 [Ophiocordyceps polyrhachis-furcata BCC 54312]|uniref:Uncharacterized protein n=1 Tax=Ophiocordyceps polyrhachis-furcata BCC 54312 TaxID=1330021 RepID=A0A367LMB1_9HYPO|nr:hypothetical protein L249_3556 [Ophiocordyceps polyrhachis-furcata BCC 54312]